MGDYAQLPEQQSLENRGWSPQQGYPYAQILPSAPYQPLSVPVYPVNPAAYPLLPPIPVPRSRDFGPAIVYFVLIALILSLGVVDLGFIHWMNYCLLDVGLLQCNYDHSEMYLKDAMTWFCLIPFDFDGCGNTCDVSRILYKAGLITFSLCIASLSSLLLSVLFLVILLFKPHWSLVGYSVRGAVALGGFLWVAGTVTYWAYFTVVRDEARHTEIGAGLGIAGVVGGLVVLACVVGMVAVSKAQMYANHP